MKNNTDNHIFNQDTASSYDSQREKLAPIKDTLHLCIQMLLTDIPEESNILCVGVGTGAELLYLAKAFPKWQFTVIEPAAAMLKICRQRAAESGISDRCIFHEGYIETLPKSDKFDAATCILVSHFIINSDDRIRFFSNIALRLNPGGYLINADLASDMSSDNFTRLVDVWIHMHNYAKMPINLESFGHKVSVIPPHEIESIIKSSGFPRPTLFFQTLLIHAWFSRTKF